MRISEGELGQITALRQSRDEAAQKLGAAVVEFDRLKAFWLERIEVAGRTERKLGDTILGRLGLSDDQTYRITDDGAVQQLDNGNWIDVDAP